jgi:SPP1 family phage portal protein
MSYGRRVIYSDATEITTENVAEEVRKAAMVHAGNRNDIAKLYGYYCGKTAILGKTKEIRESINHKVNENRAFEVTSFYQGYIFGEPIQYVRRENAESQQEDDPIAVDINTLNGHMACSGKASCDKDLGRWMLIAGTAYRMVLPNKDWSEDEDETPFKQYALDPHQTFVVYSSGVDKHPLMGVHYVERENNEIVYSVYTDKWYFEFTEFGPVTAIPHALGMIPIIEYPAEARLGIFEIVVPLLDALDELQSNRMDDIVQYVNSFLAIFGGQLDEETYRKLNEWKTLCLPEGTDARYLSATMSQSDVQTLKDDLYQSILTITGVPNRMGGSSGGDNGIAVVYRDGYATCESRSKVFEVGFKESERQTLRLALRILRDTTGTKLRLNDIETHFTRRNYENIAAKSQVLVAMLNNPKIHPELAFQHCGMFADPESAYLQSKAYYEEQMEKWEPVEVNETEEMNHVPVS